jgi:hypothetical protein
MVCCRHSGLDSSSHGPSTNSSQQAFSNPEVQAFSFAVGTPPGQSSCSSAPGNNANLPSQTSDSRGQELQEQEEDLGYYSDNDSDHSDFSETAKAEEKKEQWYRSRNKRAAEYEGTDSEQDLIAEAEEFGRAKPQRKKSKTNYV